MSSSDILIHHYFKDILHMTYLGWISIIDYFNAVYPVFL